MNKSVAALVRTHDPDRFLTAAFAPADKRDALLVLYAFNHELARAREVVSAPTLALMRLQWWREVVEGAGRRHEVAEPLSAALAAGALGRDDLLALIDAREIEADASIATLEDWRSYVLAGAGGVAVAAGRLLGAPEPEALRPLGAAYGVAGMLRSLSALARQDRCLLPEDLLREHGLSPHAVIAAPAAGALRPVLQRLADIAGGWLASPPRLPRHAIAAALPAVLARRDLRRLGKAATERGVGDRLAVIGAGMAGRV